jgi:hypothetical protein
MGILVIVGTLIAIVVVLLLIALILPQNKAQDQDKELGTEEAEE